MIRSYLKRINAKAVLFVLLTVLVVGGFLVALRNLDSGHRKEGKEQLEAAIRRSAVACYAAEGIYPPDIDYLVEHYGIQISEELYTVKYEIFASNLVPDITVLVN